MAIVKPRNEIDPKFKWKLEKIYASNEAFEEELLEELNDMTDMELKWISQYSRNDTRIAELADEVLDRRSGV